jgi:hypothetical protein
VAKKMANNFMADGLVADNLMPKSFWTRFPWAASGSVLTLLFAGQFLDGALRARSPAPVVAPPERGSHWDPEIFKILTLGEYPAAIDALLIDVLGDDRLTKVPRGTHARIFYDLELMTAVDPAYYDAYYSGANLLAVVRGDAIGARDILVRANSYRKEVLPGMAEKFKTDYWSRSWWIPLLQGYVNLFELGDLPSASVSFREAAEIPGSPEYLQSLEKRLVKPGGEYEVGLRLLHFMILVAKDDRARQEELTRKLDSLRVGQFLFELNRSFKEFLDTNRDYNASASLSPARMQSYWKAFLKKGRYSERDPWGGTVLLDASGRAATSTPHVRVFGLD